MCRWHYQCLARQPRLSYNCPPSELASRNNVPLQRAVSTLRKPASEHIEFAWRSRRPLPKPLEARCGQDGRGVHTGRYAERSSVSACHPATDEYEPPYWIAAVYAGLGDKDQAFAWLERTYTETLPLPNVAAHRSGLGQCPRRPAIQGGAEAPESSGMSLKEDR